jgi:predicted DNA-binding transcriptional regulator AlpA
VKSRLVTVPTFVNAKVIEGLTLTKAYRLIRQKTFPYPVVKMGKLVRIDIGQFEDFQNSETLPQGESLATVS